VDQKRIQGLGEGGAALAVLLSAVLDDRLQSVLLDRPIATYRSIVTSEAYTLDFSWFLYGVLKHFDIPDLLGLLSPRQCWILNATNSQGEPLPQSEISSLYDRPAKIFEQFDARGKFKFLISPEQEKGKVLRAWLQLI
jgi:hypothetical protein